MFKKNSLSTMKIGVGRPFEAFQRAGHVSSHVTHLVAYDWNYGDNYVIPIVWPTV